MEHSWVDVALWVAQVLACGACALAWFVSAATRAARRGRGND